MFGELHHLPQVDNCLFSRGESCKLLFPESFLSSIALGNTVSVSIMDDTSTEQKPSTTFLAVALSYKYERQRVHRSKAQKYLGTPSPESVYLCLSLSV